MKTNTLLYFLLILLLGVSCKKHEIAYDSAPVPENTAEYQLHYYVPVTSGAANNITRVEVNDKLVANDKMTLATYNAIPSGGVGRFYVSAAGATNIKLYKGDKQLVYDQNCTLQAGKQNIFVYDFNKPPIVFDNGFPYPKIVTDTTGSTAWIRFYNFLFETSGVPTTLKLQYQYQYTMNIVTKEKSAWINVGKPVAFGESTGWEPVTVIKEVQISSSSARIDYRIRLIDGSGADAGSLQVRNSAGNFVDYADWWNASVGRAYHHVLSGMRATTPVSAVRVFTAL